MKEEEQEGGGGGRVKRRGRGRKEKEEEEQEDEVEAEGEAAAVAEGSQMTSQEAEKIVQWIMHLLCAANDQSEFNSWFPIGVLMFHQG